MYCKYIRPVFDDVIDYQDLVLSNTSRILYYVDLHWKSSGGMWVFIHENGTKPRHDAIIPLKVETTGLYYITYDHKFRKLLPFPFTSNCIDYRRLGFENQAHAIDECVIEKSIEYLHSICCNALVYPIYNYSMMKPKSVSEKRNGRRLLYECHSLYTQPDCFAEEMIPRQTFTIPSHMMQLAITVPTNYALSVTSYPRIGIIDYLVYFGSVLGFWFGCSMIGFIRRNAREDDEPWMYSSCSQKSGQQNRNQNNTQLQHFITDSKIAKSHVKCFSPPINA